MVRLRSERVEDVERVSFFEPLFDLVFVFAVTQLSHLLLGDLTMGGAGEATLLLLAVWWTWTHVT
jgi:low temperature requirement protein LtrA